MNMAKVKLREFGEKFRPVATVLSTKDGIPTRVMFNGNEYFMIDPYQDKKNHFTNSKSRRDKKRKALQKKWSEEHGTNEII